MNRQEIESITGLELPNNFETYDDKTKEQIFHYLKNLSEIEKKVYIIAKSHLGTSFNIVKSNGFSDWLTNNK